jgi:hypothetical protein
LYFILIILTVIGAACGVQAAQSSTETTPVTPPPVTKANDEAILLLWEGPALFAGDPTECHRLRLTQDYLAFVGLCDGEQTEVEFGPNQNGGLADMKARFAPFQVDTPQGRLTFKGQGEIASPAWERAVASWARFTYAELATGRAGAANRTGLAWNVGEQGGRCQMLLVLSHGYATAGLAPCTGGQMEIIASDWVGTAEWEQFDAWLYNRAPLYQDSSYLAGWGTTDMSVEEVAALADWAAAVYARLTE